MSALDFQSGRFPIKEGAPQAARWHIPHALIYGRDVLGRGAAAAAYDVDQALGSKLVQQAAGVGRCFIKAGVTHRIGQAGAGVATDQGVGCGAMQFLDVGAHQRSAKYAVQANRQRLCVAHAVPEGGDGLARQDAPRGIGDRATDDQGQALARGFKIFINGIVVGGQRTLMVISERAN